MNLPFNYLTHRFIFLLMFLCLFQVIIAQPGSNDSTFNTYDDGSMGNGDAFPTGWVNTTKIQLDGKIIVGGYFGSYNGFSRGFITRLNSNGSIDNSFNVGTGFNNSVYAIDIQSNGQIIIGGSFLGYNGINCNNLARVNSDGSLDTAFNNQTSLIGLNGSVNAVAIQPDGKIIVGGSFYNINGISANRILRLNSDGSLDSTFITGTGFSDGVQTLNLLPDGKIIVGGLFSSYNGSTAYFMARLNSDGSLDNNFNSFFSSTVLSTSIQPDGKIIVGGNFEYYNSIPRHYIARLNVDGSLDTSFDPGTGFSNPVFAIVILSDGKIITGGEFQSYNGNPVKFISRLNSDGSFDGNFNVGYGAGGPIKSISKLSDESFIIGGNLQSFNVTPLGRIAHLFSDGSLDIDFNPKTGASNHVNTLAVQPDGKIVIGGIFNYFNGVICNLITRLNADGSNDTSFNTGTGFDSRVNSIILQSDGKILVGGYFYSYNGIALNRIARLNIDGTLDLTFNTGSLFNNGYYVKTMAIQSDGKILVAGYFTSFNGTLGNSVIRLNPDGTLDGTFNTGSGPNNEVEEISVQPDGKIVVGGRFTNFNGTVCGYIIRLNADGSTDQTFNSGSGFGYFVYDIKVQSDGKLLVGGHFTAYNGTAITRIARLNSDGTLDLSFNPGTGANRSVITISLQQNGKIIIGGQFSSINGISRNRIARLNVDGSLDSLFNPGTGFGTSYETYVYTSGIQPNGKIILGGTFTSFNGVPRNRIMRVFGDCVITPQPTDLACWQTVTFNSNTCEWDITGIQPAQPTGLACWQTAIFNSNICQWDTTGTQPAQPTDLACWQTATFNSNTCEWVITGNQPVQPTDLACWQTATFNSNTCEWDITGTQPEQSITLCHGEFLVVGNNTYSSSGIYFDTLASVNGCDSIVLINLTIQSPLNVSTNLSDTTISANLSGASYQWFNCKNNQTITGATNQTYTATANGDYAVAITYNGCTDTSECVTIENVSLAENTSFTFKLYPNPTTNKLTIELNSIVQGMEILDVCGKVIQKKKTKSNTFNVEDLSPGIYILRIESNGEFFTRQFVKQ